MKDDRMKIAEDDSGKKLRLELKYYLEYLVFNTDDSPLYLFESNIEELKNGKKLIESFSPPKYFENSYLSLVLLEFL